jgi:ribosomal-protein-alanine N-acetyltransferase
MHFEALPETDHPLVILRPIAHEDIPRWLSYLILPEVYEQTSWNRPSLDSLTRYVWKDEARAPDALMRFAIALRETNQLVGTIGFHTVMPEHRCAELAYDLAPNLWGQGIATELVRLVVEWAHSQVQLTRVQATVLDSNDRSGRVLERVGFTREGLLRSYRCVRGTAGDFWMFSHLEGEGYADKAVASEGQGDAATDDNALKA